MRNPHVQFHEHRPVRVPTEREARHALARDLCRSQQGVDEKRVVLIAHLPLMEIALNGHYGVVVAERLARRAA